MPIPAHVAPRLRVDRAKARAALQSDPMLATATDAQIDAALATVNQDALYDAERTTWTTEVWDRVSPINGVPAEHFLAREDVDENGDDDIYLLLKDGQVVLFQPHEPEVEGLVRIPKGQGLTKGRAYADSIVAGRVAEDVLVRVREHILANRPA